MKKTVLLLLFLFVASTSNAQNFPAKPINYVTEDAYVLNKQQADSLNSKLKQFEDSTTHQIFVYLSDSLLENNLEDYAQQIFDSWEVGKKGKDNGVLIVVFTADKKMRIHVGYGLEGVLTDLRTKQIQEYKMIPFFKQKKYYEAIDAGINEIIELTKDVVITENTANVNHIKPDSVANESNYKLSFGKESLVIVYIFFGASLFLFIISIGTLVENYNLKKLKILTKSCLLFLALILFIAVATATKNNIRLQFALFSSSLLQFALAFIIPIYFRSKEKKWIDDKEMTYYYVFLKVISAITLLGVLLFIIEHFDLKSDIYLFGIFIYLFGVVILLINWYNRGTKNTSTRRDDDDDDDSSSSSSGSSFGGGGGGRSGGGGSSSSW